MEIFLFLFICLLKNIFNNKEVKKLETKPFKKSINKYIKDSDVSKATIGLTNNLADNWDSWEDYYPSDYSYDSSESWYDDSSYSESVDEKLVEIQKLIDQIQTEIENIIDLDSEAEKEEINIIKKNLNELKEEINKMIELEYNENEEKVNKLENLLKNLEKELYEVIEEEKGKEELLNKALDTLNDLLINDLKEEAKKNSDKASKYKGLFIFVLVVLILLILIILFLFIKMKFGVSLFKQKNSISIESPKININ
jgi:DNA repair exonuclease SbcCD ATPase subunit